MLQSHRALEAAEETLRRALDAESGVSRYIVTGDHADLAPFERAEQSMPRVLDDLDEHVGGDAERKSVERLRSDVEELFAALRATQERPDNLEHVVESGEQTKLRIDAIRDVVRDIRRSENDRLASRMTADASASRSLGWIAIVSAAMAAALATAGAVLILIVVRPGWGTVGGLTGTRGRWP